ncbi:D-arabinose 1-dehydrogenase (NAD(P)(+)) ARA2 [Lachancea thermotolerans CBS 6340]|uniref:KLTH0D08844p n=1 Tax=Lachancea thermotolerans (strain ATCC 56472 / CBS 6340 / NRRL Y-8284) TaxID=559295 RepID=C5DGW6_LACTC|nr:KLTH0D08844p [Lachancea thermotolerans CBS 6340]CAR22658.1 KLTH0D08844p [Lachancea thermotolerans CBS 6340]
MDSLKPIGPTQGLVRGLGVENLPKLILGGATLNTQYNDDPASLPVVDMIRFAMQFGVRAIDTSPYYGDSEVLYGAALESLKEELPRENYFICTKVGRIRLEEFDYSRSHIHFSVLRSCERLKTKYLDVVFLHDVEFVETEQVLEALQELRKLRDEGVILNFGISGYPVDFLLNIALKCKTHPQIGALDVVLSYANLNLQNRTLHEYAPRFREEAGVKVVENGSILSMSLLRSQETKAFHPCSAELRKLSNEAAQYAASQGEDLASLATRYAFSEWADKGPTVLGVSSVAELRVALESYTIVADNQGKLSEKDARLANEIQSQIFGAHMNETWSSGIDHEE